jgi:O-acetylserine/cysteine efflux transporter
VSNRDRLLALVVALLWGFNFVVMKVGVAEWPPFLLAALRFGLAAFPLVLFVAMPRAVWRQVVTFGLLFGVLKFSMLFLALRGDMPAGLAAVVLQTQAILTVALAVTVLGERSHVRDLIGGLTIVAGLALIGWDRWSGTGAGAFALVLLAALFWAIANLAIKRAGGVEPIAFAVWTSAVAALPLIALSLAVEGGDAIQAAFANVTWRGAGAVLYLAYPISIVSGAIWTWLMVRNSAAAVAPFALLVPVIGLIFSAVLLGERPSPLTLTGAAFVLVGLAAAVLRPRTPVVAPSPVSRA